MYGIKLVGGPCDGNALNGEFGDQLRMVRTYGGYVCQTQPNVPLIPNELYRRSLRDRHKFVRQP
jgi:hypothetical protein